MDRDTPPCQCHTPPPVPGTRAKAPARKPIVPRPSSMAPRRASEDEPGPRPSVLFLHPDLGVGGAERLVLDAALALQARGCRVRIWTAHYDPAHCFSDSRDVPVRCAGDWLPRSLGWGRRGAAVCAYVRMVFLALYVLFLGDEEFDVVVCDQVRAAGTAAPRPRLLLPPAFLLVGFPFGGTLAFGRFDLCKGRDCTLPKVFHPEP